MESVINKGLIRSLNVISYSDLGEQSNRNSPKCQGVCCKSSETIAFPNIQVFLNIILDIVSELVYNYTIETNTFCPPSLMSVLYTPTTNKSVRVTLTLQVQDDFNARQIDWRKLFELEDNEQVESYIEEL